MKNSLLFTLLFLVCFTATKAQEADYVTYRFYEGYIIQADGTEKRGLIQYLPEPARYEKVIFKEGKKGKKKKYTPKNLKGYKVADVLYHAIQYEDVIFKGLKFLALEKDGCMKQYYHRKYNSDDQAWETISILVTKDRSVSTQTFLLKFADKMAELVKDQPELAAKVKNKEKGYRILGLYNIVDEYNANCTQ